MVLISGRGRLLGRLALGRRLLVLGRALGGRLLVLGRVLGGPLKGKYSQVLSRSCTTTYILFAGLSG